MEVTPARTAAQADPAGALTEHDVIDERPQEWDGGSRDGEWGIAADGRRGSSGLSSSGVQ